jgi:PAS domain S-box-containing protein
LRGAFLMDEQAGLAFLAGGGEAGALMRALDWSSSPLGGPGEWPQSLRSVVGLLLTSEFPMFVAWGDELGLLYNDAYAEILGNKHPSALGQRFRNVWSEIWTDISPLIDAALAGQAVYREDLPLVLSRSGAAEQAWFTFSYSPVRNESGQVTGMFCAVTETTGKVQADRRNAFLVELSDYTRDLLDPQAIMDVAAEALGRQLDAFRAGYGEIDGAFIDVKGGWHDAGVAPITGRHRLNEYGEALIRDYRAGRTVAVADFSADPRATASSADAHAALDVRAQIVVPLVKGGRPAALLFVHSSMPRSWTDADQKLAEEVAERTWAAVERARAVTALHQSEARLRELNETLESQVEARTQELAGSEARFRAYFDTSPENLFLLRVPPERGVVFEDLNPAAETLCGLPRDAVLEHSLVEVLDPETAADIDRRARECLGLGQPLRYETPRRFQFGRELVLNVVAAPLPPPAGGDARVLFSKRDVTEQRLSEEALRQSQKMEAVGQLTGGLAHDFNNLLSGISGNLELLQMRVVQGRINDLERYIAAAQGASKRAAALTHRLLAFTRRQTLDPKPTDLNRLVAGMEELVRRTMGPQIEVEVVGAAGLWMTLVDPNQLENALLNLCINARDAMPDGGRLTVESANKWLDAPAARERELPPGQYVSLCVSDTGTGMTPEVARRAFEPFYTTKPIGMGTGLGLSMIYGFVQQSGGQARINSEAGQGTAVCLYLPRHQGSADAEDQAEKAVAPRAEQGETVLVVDDEPTVRMLVTEVLTDLGYIAIEAVDGPAGLQVLRSNARIDLLVTDVGLPGGMNGRQVADAARVVRPRLKVLFITGYAENAVLSHGHLDPGMHVLTKPFAMEVLASRIRELIADTQEKGAS